LKTLTAQARDLWHARSLCGSLTRREIASRYVGTALGAVWVYAQPLLTIAAYYLVFDVVFAMRLGADAPTHAVGTYLISGMLPWMAFTDALNRAMNSLIESASVLQKNALPPMLFPLRAVLASSAAYAPVCCWCWPTRRAPISWPPLLFPRWCCCKCCCASWGTVLAILRSSARTV
jgi:lipopolysaccharide transport system permease protein